MAPDAPRRLPAGVPQDRERGRARSTACSTPRSTRSRSRRAGRRSRTARRSRTSSTAAASRASSPSTSSSTPPTRWTATCAGSPRSSSRCWRPTRSSSRRRRSRPPTVEFHWGRTWTFPAVIDSLSVQYTLFRPDGTPIRAHREALADAGREGGRQALGRQLEEGPEPDHARHPRPALARRARRRHAALDRVRLVRRPDALARDRRGQRHRRPARAAPRARPLRPAGGRVISGVEVLVGGAPLDATLAGAAHGGARRAPRAAARRVLRAHLRPRPRADGQEPVQARRRGRDQVRLARRRRDDLADRRPGARGRARVHRRPHDPRRARLRLRARAAPLVAAPRRTRTSRSATSRRRSRSARASRRRGRGRAAACSTSCSRATRPTGTSCGGSRGASTARSWSRSARAVLPQGRARRQKVALKWGEGLTTFRPRVTGVQQVDEVVVRSWNAKTKEVDGVDRQERGRRRARSASSARPCARRSAAGG